MSDQWVFHEMSEYCKQATQPDLADSSGLPRNLCSFPCPDSLVWPCERQEIGNGWSDALIRAITGR
jgi:hypothetical protein